MSSPDFQVLLFYKYLHISDPIKLQSEQQKLCQTLGLKGRVIVAKEGINATLEGETSKIQQYCSDVSNLSGFSDIDFKISLGTGRSFPKLSVKVREEIVSTHLDLNLDPNKLTGKYISAEELHDLFRSQKEFYIVDMRNDYEHSVGHFKNSILPKLGHFRDLPKILSDLSHLKNKKIITVCTGGVRCEKASGFLILNGFTDVYQLNGGIVKYMEKYPNQDFLGKLYVFDQRIIIGFHTDSEQHQVIGRCLKCGVQSESFTNCAFDDCHKHFICCKNCASKDKVTFCSLFCKEQTESSKQFAMKV
jgi:UPF0176 protein